MGHDLIFRASLKVEEGGAEERLYFFVSWSPLIEYWTQKPLTAANVPGRKTVVMMATMFILALSCVAARAIRFWSSEIAFSAAVSLTLRAASCCAMRLYIYSFSSQR